MNVFFINLQNLISENIILHNSLNWFLNNSLCRNLSNFFNINRLLINFFNGHFDNFLNRNFKNFFNLFLHNNISNHISLNDFLNRSLNNNFNRHLNIFMFRNRLLNNNLNNLVNEPLIDNWFFRDYIDINVPSLLSNRGPQFDFLKSIFSHSLIGIHMGPSIHLIRISLIHMDQNGLSGSFLNFGLSVQFSFHHQNWLSLSHI